MGEFTATFHIKFHTKEYEENDDMLIVEKLILERLSIYGFQVESVAFIDEDHEEEE
jgi:hypothetical protein